MKTFKKRLIAFAALCCVALGSATGCSSKDNSSDSEADLLATSPIEFITNENGALIQAPLQEIVPSDLSGISFDDNVDPNAPAKTTQTATEYVVVTDSSNQPVTEYVVVTEAGGETVTDAEGAAVTTAVEVTEAVVVTTAPDEYVSKTDSRYLYWMDLSKDEDFMFEGQFIKLTFKIKDNAPERDYPIGISTDLATCAGQSLNDKTKRINGTIRVGGSIDPQDASSVSGLCVYGDNVSAKPGDTVEYYINIKNNPGMVAAILWVSYDENAMEYNGYKAAGDFADIAKNIASNKK